ncbi:hypothetical protein Ciccas_004125, partial [Cichlidogyrus casuarinus]
QHELTNGRSGVCLRENRVLVADRITEMLSQRWRRVETDIEKKVVANRERKLIAQHVLN